MPDLLPGSRIEVRQPSVPRVQVEQPAGASTSVFAPIVDWRAALAAYTEAVDETIDSKVTAAVAAHTPGIELAYAERTTNFATTSTVHGAGALVPSLVVSVVGQGREVDIRFNAQTVLHSVADTGVLCGYEVNNSATSNLCQSTVVSSPSNTVGRGMDVSRRVILTDGVTYTIKAYCYGLAAGTSTIVAAAFAPMSLSVTSR